MLWAPEGIAEFAATAPKLAPLLAILQEMIPPTFASIGEERLRWLEGLPFQYSQQDFSLVHASPNDLWRAPTQNATDDELQNTYASLGAQVAVYGHIHRPYIRRLLRMTVANTGSVSQSYDRDRRASCLVIDGESITIRESNMTWRVKLKNFCILVYPTLTGCPGFSSPESTVLPKNGRW